MALVTLASCPVDYVILNKNPAQLDGEEGQYTAELTFGIDMKDIAAFAEWAGGKAYTVTVGGSPVQRIIPLSHPAFPGLLCKSIKCSGAGGYTPSNPTGLENWEKAKVTLGFRSVPYGIDGQDPFLVKSGKGFSETTTLAGSQCYFPSDNTPIGTDAGLNTPVVDFQYQFFQCASLDLATLTDLAGKISSVTFLGLAAGYILYKTFDYSESRTAFNLTTFTKTLYFQWRKIHHNYFLRPNGVWEIAYKPGATPMYDSVDLNALLT